MIPGVPSPLVNHLWQSTLFVGLVWLATLALRHNGARVRYRLWMAASLKFLVPLSWLVSLGAQFEWRTAPAVARPVASLVSEQVLGTPVPDGVVMTAAPQVSVLPSLLLGIWLAGFTAVLFWWWRQWLPVRAARRAARPVRLDEACDARGLRVMSSCSTIEPGVVGIWQPVLLVPEGLLDHLTPTQMNALLAHERHHVRHLDNLVAAIHMAVEAVFWFHPLVWWIEQRMIHERERACDEDVLRSGNPAVDYAEGILAVCRLSVRAPLACVAGVTGSDLRRRIESILRGTLSRPMSGAQRCALAFGAASCLGIPLVVGAVNAAPLVAVGQDVATPVRFEVASVKPNRSGERSANFGDRPGGRFEGTNVPLRRLITEAYQISDNQLLDAPDWISVERFDIAARLDAEPPAVPRGQSGLIQLALRTLLAERFRLEVRRETREFPMYALVMARRDGKPGPMLTPSRTDCSPETVKARLAAAQAGQPAAGVQAVAGMCGSRFNTGRIRFGGYPISDFARVFSPYNGRSVVDRTGLKGNWDFDLTFTPDVPPAPQPGQEPPVFDPNGPSLITAMEEQLGLKLEPLKGLVEVLVVERIDRPTPD